MRVWLDDMAVRDPSSGWTVVRTADEAIELLMVGNVEAISLDHDLGDFRQDPYPREVTGMDVVNWMVANKVFPKVINVHSHNGDRAKFMVRDLEAVAPEWVAIRMWRFDTDTVKELEQLL
jgi:hypothetical protein